jgi:hypothetical protein
MARTIQQIQNQIINSKNSYTELNGLDSPSQTAIWKLWTFIVAVSISFLEQIIDLFKVEIEGKLQNHVAGTKNWINNNILLFQYSATDPQIVEISDDYLITYSVVNTNLQIIKQVAIEVLDNNVVQIKVAKSSPPEPLDSSEKSALSSFLTEIMPAGIQTSLYSENSDKIYIKGNIYYNGMYSAIIQSNVETAINTYLENLPFGGKFVVQELEAAILAVAGINDINISRIQARRDNQTFVYGSNNPVYVLEGTTSDINNRSYSTFAGYVITETTTSYTISDSLTYIAQ